MTETHHSPPTRKRLLVVLSIVLGSVAVLAATAPALISGPGKSLIVSRINADIPGTLMIEELSLSWGGPQQIEGLRLFDESGGEIINVGRLATGASLFALAAGDYCRGSAEASELRGRLTVAEDGRWNVDRALSTAAAPGASAPADERSAGVLLPQPLHTVRCDLQLERINLSVDSGGMQAIRIDDLNGRLSLQGRQRQALSLQAGFHQGEAGGRLAFNATASELFDSRGRLQLAAAELEIDADVAGLPVDLLDRLAGMQGRMSALLGQRLEHKIDARVSDGAGKINVTALSSGQAGMELKLELENGILSATEQARMLVTVTPEAWRKLGAPDTELRKPFTMRMDAARLAWPLSAPSDTALEAKVTISDIELRHADPAIGAVALRNTTATITSERLREAVALRLETAAEQQRRSGNAVIDARLEQWLDEDLAFTPARMNTAIEGSINALPLAVFDQLLAGGGMLTELFGEQLDAGFRIDLPPGGQAGKLALKVESRRVQADIDATLDDNALRLAAGELDIDLQPAMAGKLVQAVELARPARIHAAIQELEVPRRDQGLAVDAARLQMQLDSERLDLRDSAGNTMQLRAARLTLQSERLSDASTVRLRGSLNGGALQVDADLKDFNLLQGGHPGAGSTLALEAEPAAAGALLPGGLEPGGQLRTQAGINPLPPAGLQLDGSIEPLAIRGDPGFTLTQTRYRLQIAGDDSLSFTAGGQLEHPAGQGAFTAEASLSAPGSGGERQLRQAGLRLNNMPAEAADGFAGMDGTLAGLLGGSFDLDLAATPKTRENLTLSVGIDAPELQGALQGSYDAGRVVLERGSRLTVSVDRNDMDAFLPESEWQLQEPARLDLAIDELRAELAGGRLRYKDLAVSGRAQSPNMRLRHGGQPPDYRFSDLDTSFSTPRLSRSLEIDINAALLSSAEGGGGNVSGTLRSSNSLRDLLDQDGGFNFTGAALSTRTRIDRVDSRLALAMLNQDPNLAAALGPVISAAFEGSIPGNIDVQLLGSGTRAVVSGNVDEARNLRLNRDAEFEMLVTETLVDDYLSKLHPLLAEIQGASEPLRLTIRGEDFFLPLADYDHQAISASGRLEIGMLAMSGGAITGGLFMALRGLGGQVGNPAGRLARFNPLEFQVRDGVVRTNDIWMVTSDNLMLGSQARLHLPERWEDEVFAEVLFAVPGQTLQLIPRLSNTMPPDQLFEISDSAPISELDPDFSKLMSAVITQNLGGLVSNVTGNERLGGVLGMFGQIAQQAKSQKAREASGDYAPGTTTGWAGATWPNMPVIQQQAPPPGG